MNTMANVRGDLHSRQGVLRVSVGLVLLAVTHGPSARAQQPDPAPAAGSFQFLAQQHDLFHEDFIVYDDRDSGAVSHFPSGMMGDFARLPADRIRECVTDGWPGNPHRGTTCLRLHFPPELARQGGWAGVYLQHPDKNWGEVRGLDLSRYNGKTVELSFWARGKAGGETVEFKTGGIGTPDTPFRDGFGPLSAGNQQLRLSDRWVQWRIPMQGTPLGSWAGGFCWAASGQFNPRGCEVFVDDIRLVLTRQGKEQRLNEPRLIRSYVPPHPHNPDKYFRNVCFCYDQSLAVIAFVARGSADDLRRARLILDALIYAQKHDRHYKDGRLRTAYCCGDLCLDRSVANPWDPGQKSPPRLPGWWEDEKGVWAEDVYCMSTDCGNLSWVMLALLSYWEKADRRADSPYLQSAVTLGEWIHRNCYSDAGPGGYTGGVEGPDGDQTAVGWKSTEHNIDIYAAFARLGNATGDRKWLQRADHARKFVGRMRNPQGGHLWTGTQPDGVTINKEVIPLDIHPWAVLAFRDPDGFRKEVQWAHRMCLVDPCPVDGVSRGYDFNARSEERKPDDLDGVWWEGTAQMQLAFRAIKDHDRARQVLDDMRAAASRAWKDPTVPVGAIVAASKDRLTTGFKKEWGQWVYYRRPHVGATCWFILAELGWNPYWNEKI